MDTIAYILGLLFGGILTFWGKFLFFLVCWFIFVGIILERLISKSGHTGTFYRVLFGAPFLSAVPLGLSLAADQYRGIEVFSSIHITIDWFILVYLSLAPWPIRRAR
jgi:hypothetical protein